MKQVRLMVVLLLSVSCVANRAESPSVAAEMKRSLPRLEDTVISDRGTSIAGQRLCWIYEFTATRFQRRGWHECEARKALEWWELKR